MDGSFFMCVEVKIQNAKAVSLVSAVVPFSLCAFVRNRTTFIINAILFVSFNS